MTQTPSTFTLTGGLDLVSAPIVVPPGHALAACNYLSDDRGYSRIKGYERFDGRPAPSSIPDPDDKIAARALIAAVPGTGPIRGVWVYAGSVWAFRDTVAGAGAMYRSTASGWVAVVTGWRLNFTQATSRLREGATVIGATSGASGEIRREVLQNGAYDGSAAGYLVLYDVIGTFLPGEEINAESGMAVASTFLAATLRPGGKYRFVNRNFYGSINLTRMYFVNGVQSAFEFDGTTLSPIETGATGLIEEVIEVLDRTSSVITLRDEEIVYLRSDFDRPNHIAEFANHLWLTYPGGSMFFSGVGEPMEYRAVGGAGEIGVGEELTGLLPNASTSLIVFCRSSIKFITGTSATNFVLEDISGSAGAFPDTVQTVETPVYLDDGGIRSLSTTQAFGDWKLGAISYLVSPLLQALLNSGTTPIDSVTVRQRSQYRMFWADGTGLAVYFGRKRPEVMPFKLKFSPSCVVAGETDVLTGKERIFAGSADGFVYEMESGNSFDGASAPAFVTIAWHHVSQPQVEKRFFMSGIEVDAPDCFHSCVRFQVEYNRPSQAQGQPAGFFADQGTQQQLEIGDYADFDWTKSAMGQIKADLAGLGTNIAVTLQTDTIDEAPHSLTAMTINFSPRKVKR